MSRNGLFLAVAVAVAAAQASPALAATAQAGHAVQAGQAAQAGRGAAGAQTAEPDTAPGNELLIGEGLDSCTAPSESQMSAFFSNTPYSGWGVYIGGKDRACSQPNLTPAWVSAVVAQGWHLFPLWVGPQNPCVPGFDHFSTNTATAYTQGKAQAVQAHKAVVALGMRGNSPLIYDMESGGTSTTACIDATESFIQGWVSQIHVAPNRPAGVYTSTCGGFIDDFASLSPPPDFIHGADWDDNPNTNVLACVATNHWTNHQRLKQYQGGHNETWNGVTLNVDSDCSNGPSVALAPYTGGTACL